MNRIIPCLLAGLAAGGLVGCDKTTATGTSDDTHSSIMISGRVFTDQNKPLGAVIVKLRHAGLADTTDGDGLYSITGNQTALAARSLATVDTLDYLRDGVVVQSSSVSGWITTMPDLFLVQRDISGALNAGPIAVTSVMATLWNQQGDSTTIDLEWNTESNRYSGFAWFRYTGGLDSFQVQTAAIDAGGHLIGISKKLAFTSKAGNLQIPSFDAGNLLPNIPLGPHVLQGHRRDTLRIREAAKDPRGLPLEYLWSIDGGAWIAGTSDTLLAISATAPPSLDVVVKISRADGVFLLDTFRLQISSYLPKASVSFLDLTRNDSTGAESAFQAKLGEVIRIHFTDSDTLGASIIRRRIGAPWNLDVSGRDTILTLPSDQVVSSALLPLRYTVSNDQGDSCTAISTLVLFAGNPKEFSATADSSFLKASWQKPKAFAVTGWTLSVLDSSGDIADSYELAPDSTSARIVRTSPTRQVRVKLSMHVNDGLQHDTNIVVATPNLKWNFEAIASHPKWPDAIGYPSAVTISEGGTTLISRRYDSSLQGMAGRFEFHFGPEPTFSVATLVLPISDWRGVKSWSFRARSSDSLQLDFRLGSRLIPAYEQASLSGVRLGWNANIPPEGAVVNLPIDSIAWPKWSDPQNWPQVEFQQVLDAATTLNITVICTKNEGICPNQQGFLVLDDIEFQR